jgi:drug/metabolite transporter (DMT)-like permease
MTEGAGQRTVAALGCAAVAVLLPLVAPDPFIRWGWLLGGAVTIVQGAARYYRYSDVITHTNDALVSIGLFAGILVAVVLMQRFWREPVSPG